jgi:hypothetical protein
MIGAGGKRQPARPSLAALRCGEAAAWGPRPGRSERPAALDAALAYAARGRRVFPCHWQGERRKHPLTVHGLYDASPGPAIIDAWWRRWQRALIGAPTGRLSGFVVLDVDVKDAYGFDTLDDLGFAILPDTPMVHTASGGLHLYFAPPDGVDLRNTEGAHGRGIGPGLDWRGAGGYVIAPSPGSGYQWDPHWNLGTVPLAPVPAALLPREVKRPPAGACPRAAQSADPRAGAGLSDRPVRHTVGLSPYAEAALDSACRRIIAAPAGEQESTVNAECFKIGTLAGAGGIPADFARRALLHAAHRMPDYDRRRPWRAREIEAKVDRSLDAGMHQPRKARHA